MFAAAMRFLTLVAAAAALQRFPSTKLVLLDRDGVLNRDVGAPGVVRPEDLELIPGAGESVARLRRAGLKVALVTNQSCVGKGAATRDTYDRVHEKLVALLQQEAPDAGFDGVYVCFSADADPRKKPEPGMVLEAMRELGVERADECVFVGDNWETDMLAAARAGVPRILVATGYGSSVLERLREDGCTQPPGGTPIEGSRYGIPQACAPLLFVADVSEAARCITDGRP